MKQAMNFRLSLQTIAILTALEQRLHKSKTAVVEEALSRYANEQIHTPSDLLEFAGLLSEKEADTMLNTIQAHKHNKKIKTAL